MMESIDKLTELAQKILQVNAPERKPTGLSNILSKIANNIPRIIKDCRELVDNSDYRFAHYLDDAYENYFSNTSLNYCVKLITDNKPDIDIFEADTEDEKAQRQQKLKQYQHTISIQSPLRKVGYYSKGKYCIELVRDVYPDLIYCQYGIYRRYWELHNSFYYKLSRKIQISFSYDKKDLETVCQMACLFIALKNEQIAVREELDLLGVKTEVLSEAVCLLPKQVLLNELNAEDASKNTLEDNNKTFHSGDTEENLKVIFERLKREKYFDAEADIQTWLYICGVGKQQATHPLNWVNEQQLLANLIDVLFGDSDGQRLWIIAQKVFTVKGKQLNIGAMKNTISRIRNKWKDRPKKFDNLERLLRV